MAGPAELTTAAVDEWVSPDAHPALLCRGGPRPPRAADCGASLLVAGDLESRHPLAALGTECIAV